MTRDFKPIPPRGIPPGRRLVFLVAGLLSVAGLGYAFTLAPGYPLWCRMLGWAGCLLLMLARPAPPPIRRVWRLLSVGGPEKVQQRLRIRLTHRPGDRAHETARLSRVMLRRRLGLISWRALLGVAVAGALFHGAVELLMAPNPAASMWSRENLTPLIPLVHHDAFLNRHLQSQILAATWIALMTLGWRYEFLALEYDHPRRLTWALHITFDLGRTLLHMITRGLLWAMWGVILLFIGLYAASLIYFGATGNDLAWLAPSQWPRRPRVEFGYLALAGAFSYLLRLQSVTRESMVRQMLFANSLLLRHEGIRRAWSATRCHGNAVADRFPDGNIP